MDESDGCEGIEEIRKGMHELTVRYPPRGVHMELIWMTDSLKTQTWDWAFGQTPEFTYTLEHTFSWGRLVSDLGSASSCSQLKFVPPSSRRKRIYTQNTASSSHAHSISSIWKIGVTSLNFVVTLTFSSGLSRERNMDF